MSTTLTLPPLGRPSSPSVEPSAARIRGALDRITVAAAPDRSDAELLLAARGAELERLLAVAGAVRDIGLREAGRPGVITYSRKVFIPLTRLCRDRCHYCVFVQTPRQLDRAGERLYLSEDEVLEIARQGAALGCKEALLTLGDRPEDRWEEAREWLSAHGYASTLDYVAAMARRITDETGLMAHLNPGVMTWAELQRLRPVAPSMGMMLETTSARLWAEKGNAHYGSPDKDPALRLRVIDDAGRSRIPFTTGVLLGIGETDRERVDALIALRESHERHGHIQEVIVQNFRAKPSTAMRGSADLDTQEYAAAVATARLLLGPSMRLQAPPNLTDAEELSLLLRAGVDDWGGVSPLTPDHVNPERPWPQIERLAQLTAANGFTLRERLTAHPHYIRGARDPHAAARGGHGGDWFDDRLAPAVLAAADSYGLARRDAYLEGVLDRAESDPAGLHDAEYLALLHADGDDLEALTALADRVRRERVGDQVTFVVNRNLDPAAAGASADTTAAVGEAIARGATEICAQGELPDGSYLAFVRAAKAAGAVHLHAFRPSALMHGASAAGVPLDEWMRRLKTAGVDTVPGTDALILDDGIRRRLNPDVLSAEDWERIIRAAHGAGLRSTATMVFGHLDGPAHQLAHLRTLQRIQLATSGFTEFIPMPWVPADGAHLPADARRGPTLREIRAVVAVARLLFAGTIDHIQAAWPKFGLRTAQLVLAGGADDLGGLLLGSTGGTPSPEAGRELTLADAQRLTGEIGRTVRRRTTDYGMPR